MRRKPAALFVSVLFCACGAKASFETSGKINGEDPKGAAHPIFGAARIETDEGPISAIVQVVSDHADLCAFLETYPDGLNGYLDDVLDGEVDTKMVTTIFAKEGEYPRDGDSFSGGSEVHVLLNLFGVSKDKELLVFAIDDAEGSITFDKFSKGRAPVLSGSLSTTLVFDFVSEDGIDVGLTGSFQRAKYCEKLDHFFDDEGRGLLRIDELLQPDAI